MPTKPLNKYAGIKPQHGGKGAPDKQQSDAAKVNEYDRDSGQAVTDGFSESDPNGMGPTMRQVYTATAGAFSDAPEYVFGDFPANKGKGQLNGKYNGADMHTDHYEAPYPRRQTGAAAQGYRGTKTGDDERTGVSGKWPDSDT